MDNRIKRDLNFYLSLYYPITVYPCEEGGYVAEVKDLPGCFTQAETIEELFVMIEDANRCWIETALLEGRDIPLPQIQGEQE